MKKSRLSYESWTCITKKEVKSLKIKTDEFSGHLCRVCIDNVTSPQIWNIEGREYDICDSGCTWLSMLPEDDYYCVRAIMDKNNDVVLWYIDMIAGQGADPDGIRTFDDLYLDLVVLPDGRYFELDMDELKEALETGCITDEQYRLALDTCRKLEKQLKTSPGRLYDFTFECLKYFGV